MPDERPTLVMRREIRSDSNAAKLYTVSVFSDGGATCSCIDYIIRGVNQGNLNYRCKHIRRVLTNTPVIGPGGRGDLTDTAKTRLQKRWAGRREREEEEAKIQGSRDESTDQGAPVAPVAPPTTDPDGPVRHARELDL